MNPVFLIGIAVTVFCALALVFVLFASRPSETEKRVLEIAHAPLRIEEEQPLETNQPLEAVFSAVRFLRQRLGLSEDEKLRQRFIAAGLRDEHHTDLYFAIRLLGPVVAILLGSFLSDNRFFWIVLLLGIAYLLPDLWLNALSKRRREKIRLSLPDALDLMVVCVDAGLGLDQALLRVGQELGISHPQLSEELLQINLEQRAGKPRVDAWRAMAGRTNLEIIRNFASMLAQTERFGTPIAKSLISFADTLRIQRRQQVEENAAKTSIKLLFPLVCFIFPCMFIVLLAPAILSISRNIGVLLK